MIFEPKENICILNTWDFDCFVHDELSLANNMLSNGTIIINSLHEYEYPNLDHEYLKNFDYLLNENNNKMIIVYGTHQYWLSDYNNIQIIECPAFFLKISNFPNKRRPFDIKKPFCTLINRPHEFRCKFIDKIYEKKINSYFNLSWNILTPTYLGYQYPFKYFEEKIHKFDDGYEDGANWIIPPNEYFESLFDIVLESTTDCKFYTEKTTRPIYYKKPFILFGDSNINKGLTDFGFKLYDEIIDYRFDSEDDIDNRMDMMISELRKLKKINPKKIQTLLNQKIEHNFLNLMKIQKQNHFTFDLFDKVFNKINLSHLQFKLNNTNALLSLKDTN